MINNLLSFLQDSYAKNSGNRSYAIIIRALQRMGKVPPIQHILMALATSGDVKTDFINEEKRTEISDYRIYNLSVKSLRKLHAPLGEDEYVGVSFIQEKQARNANKVEYEPVSCLLLGANGIGKTSLFCSLEIAAIGSSNIARNHGFFTEGQQRKFLSYNDGAVNPTIRLCTNSGIVYSTVESNKIQSLQLPQAFLCSSYDISKLEGCGIDSEYLMTEMGKPEFIYLSVRLKSTREILNLLEEYKAVDELLPDADKGSNEESSLKERKDSFERQIKNKLRVRLIREPLIKLSATDYKRLSQEVDDILSSLETEIQRIFKTLLGVSQHIIPNILKDFLSDCELDIRMVNGVPSVNLFVKNDDDARDIQIEPRQFFNTFRLKLFTIAIKLSMSCCVKIIDRINFPFVIDDTFDASDFISKGEIKKFIGYILLNHNEIKALERYPLQLIIFTQDDIIAQKAYQGLTNYTQSGDFRPLFLKIYDCKESTQDDFITEELNDNEISYFNIVDKIIG